MWSPWTFNFDALSNHETTAQQEHQQPQESGEEQLNQAMDSSWMQMERIEQFVNNLIYAFICTKIEKKKNMLKKAYILKISSH